MAMNEALDKEVGKKVKVYLRGALILKGRLEKFYCGESKTLGKMYQFAIVREPTLTKGKYIRTFASIDVLSFEVMK